MLLNLSRRETQCARLLAQGKTHKEIAVALGIAERTVHSYMESARRKTSSPNSEAFVRWCCFNGVISDTVLVPPENG